MPGWTGLSTDIRVVGRGLARARGFTLTVVGVLALAVAANAALFAFVQGTLLDRPPYREPETLVLAWGSEPVNGQRSDVISGSNFVDLRERSTTLAGLAGFHGNEAVVLRDGRSDVLPATSWIESLRARAAPPSGSPGFGSRHVTAWAAAPLPGGS